MPVVDSIVTLFIIVAVCLGTIDLTLGAGSLVSTSSAALVQQLQAKSIDLITRGFFWLFAALLLGRALRYTRAEASHASAEAFAPPPAPAPVPMPLRWAGGQESWNAVVTMAREWLAEIRFQRSYSQGWSGSLKLPVGVEGSVNQAFSWSQRQLSLPELAKAYTDFVSDIAEHALVVIAIDELDKIGTDQKAHEFLNEIKAVFGIERCFYLLSVSDSAMSSFARRGLPVRDAFDSALDEVVRVEYLTLDAANELISRRIIRFPLPFVSFCHCLAGGLPRDVIRACRDVFDAAESVPSRKLQDVARAVLRQDLRQKIAATVTAVQQSEGSDDATPIIDSLGCLVVETLTSARLLGDYSDIVDAAASASSATCRSLAIDLATYYLYAATLLEIFDRASAADSWSDWSEAETFDELANLRRRLEIDSDACRGAILRLRARCTLSPPRAETPRPTAARLPRRYLPRLSVKRADV